MTTEAFEKWLKDARTAIKNNMMFSAQRVSILLAAYDELRALFNAHLEGHIERKEPIVVDPVPAALNEKAFDEEHGDDLTESPLPGLPDLEDQSADLIEPLKPLGISKPAKKALGRIERIKKAAAKVQRGKKK